MEGDCHVTGRHEANICDHCGNVQSLFFDHGFHTYVTGPFKYPQPALAASDWDVKFVAYESDPLLVGGIGGDELDPRDLVPAAIEKISGCRSPRAIHSTTPIMIGTTKA